MIEKEEDFIGKYSVGMVNIIHCSKLELVMLFLPVTFSLVSPGSTESLFFSKSSAFLVQPTMLDGT